MPKPWITCSEDRLRPGLFIYTCAEGHSWELTFEQLEALIDRDNTSAANTCTRCEKEAEG